MSPGLRKKGVLDRRRIKGARERATRMDPVKRLGILVGGGPAPGINSVIGAAAIRARLEGVEAVSYTHLTLPTKRIV